MQFETLFQTITKTTIETDARTTVENPHIPREGETIAYGGDCYIVREITTFTDDSPPQVRATQLSDELKTEGGPHE